MRSGHGSRSSGPVAAVVLLGTALVALVVAVRVRDGSAFGWDSTVHSWVLRHRPRGLTDLAIGLTSSATAAPAYAAVALAGVLGASSGGRAPGGRRARLLGGVAAVLALAAGQLVRIALATWVGRPRPPGTDWLRDASGPSFPSGHTTTAALVASVVCVALRRARPRVRRIGSAAVLTWAVGVGLTRVYLGVHWPSDVLGGWLLAALLATILSAVAASRSAGTAPTPAATRAGGRSSDHCAIIQNCSRRRRRSGRPSGS